MVAYPSTSRLTIPLAPAGAVTAAAVVALAVLLAPADLLQAAVIDSGMPALVAFAAPPLGLATRVAAAVAGGIVVGALLWSVLFLAIGRRALAVRLPLRVPLRHDAASLDADPPAVRRADAHPDAPPRRPVFASADLGTPFLDVRAEQVVERDLPDPDERLLDFDPGSAPDVPREPVRPVAPLVRFGEPLAPGERMATFPLAQPPADRPAASIESLLDRLEGRAARPSTPPPRVALDAALLSLRQLAAVRG